MSDKELMAMRDKMKYIRESIDILMTHGDTMSEEGLDFIINIIKKEIPSFDGTSKSDEGRGQNIKYWQPTSPELEELKRKVLAKASPEAIAYLDPLNYNGPLVVADGSLMSDEEWQAARRNSIGSSSAFKTRKGLTTGPDYDDANILAFYYEKIDRTPIEQLSKAELFTRELIFEWGHQMESFLHKWVRLHWGDCKLVIDTNIYASPILPFLTSNLDGMLQLPDGTWEHVEFKTTTAFNEEYANGIPIQYKCQIIQCQHIMNVWKSRLVVFKGRDIVLHYNDTETFNYERDLDEEYIQLLDAKDFWENHVLPQIPPEPINGRPGNILDTIKKYSGPGNKKLPEVIFDMSIYDTLEEFHRISQEIAALEVQKKKLQTLKEACMVDIALAMGDTTIGYGTDGNRAFSIKFAPRATPKKCDFNSFKRDHPDLYDKYVTENPTGARPMTIKEVDVRV